MTSEATRDGSDACLREVERTERRDGHRLRRWFSCQSADLYVWYEDEVPVGFEFCFGKPRAEHAVRWGDGQGLSHTRIDDGQADPFSNRTPIAVPNGRGDPRAALRALDAVGAGIAPDLLAFVRGRLEVR